MSGKRVRVCLAKKHSKKNERTQRENMHVQQYASDIIYEYDAKYGYDYGH